MVASAHIGRPPKTGRPNTAKSILRRSSIRHGRSVKPRRRTKGFGRDTRPPASRQTCIHARSTGYALLCRRPASRHQSRSNPSRSKRELQDGPGQRSALVQSGNMTRRRHSFGKQSAGATIAGSKKKVAKKSPTYRPHWLRRSAFPVGGNRSYKDANAERSRASSASPCGIWYAARGGAA